MLVKDGGSGGSMPDVDWIREVIDNSITDRMCIWFPKALCEYRSLGLLGVKRDRCDDSEGNDVKTMRVVD